MKVRIGQKFLGEGEPCFIIAEAGVNHNGDVRLAKKLVDAAKEAKADAVKFQAFKAEKIATRSAEKAEYQTKNTRRKESQLMMLKRLELRDEDFRELHDYAKKKNIIFLSSAFDRESVDLLNGLGVPAFKIASGELTNYPLLKYTAEKRKPIVLSTGMSTLDEIGNALKVIKENGTDDIVLLHCVTSYPAKIEDTNLKVMETLRRKFMLPVGFSDHTLGITIPMAAVALGAVLIEKHFTLDRDLPGPDHKSSLEPNELKQMITAIRDVEKALGDGIRRLTENEKRIREIARRSIVARMKIRKGSILREDMLDFKRPGTGLEPGDLNKVVGKRAKKDIEADELISFEKLW